jgi:hypothetical protein
MEKIIYRWKDRQLMMSNGPAAGMLLIRRDDGTTVAVVIPADAFAALWGEMTGSIVPVETTEDE